MNLPQVMNIDVLDKPKLKQLGYDESNYYCGNWGFMPFWTKVRNLLSNIGVCFPFNPACFLHDLGYSHSKKLTHKLRADYKFLRDMQKIINSIKSKQRRTDQEKLILLHEKHLVRRMWVYFIIVSVFLTPIWVLYQKFK